MPLQNPNQSVVHLRPARVSDAPTLARMMTEAISWGRLSDLGPAFVRLLHRHMIRSRYAVCIVAEEGDTILGYIAGTTDTRLFYREFLFRYGLVAAVQVLPRLWHPRNLQTAIRGFTHFPASPKDDPKAEALSFAVQPGVKQKGIGSLLFQALIDGLRTRGVTTVKFATVDPANETAIAFYRKLGCTLLRTGEFYRDNPVLVYVYDIPGANDSFLSRTID